MSFQTQRYKGSGWQMENGWFLIQPQHFNITQASAGKEVRAVDKIHIKTLAEIRQEKADRLLRQGAAHEAGTRGTTAASPTERSAMPPGVVHMKTLSELRLERKRKLVREGEEELRGRSEAPFQWEVPEKKAATQPGEIRVKTLEEIRREKAARTQTKVQEVKAEVAPAPPCAQLKRRILRINRNTATGADRGSDARAREARPAAPSTTEGPVPLVRVAVSKIPTKPHSRHQSTATPHTSGSIHIDDFDELINEFAEDLLGVETELDPMNEDDLILELMEMINS